MKLFGIACGLGLVSGEQWSRTGKRYGKHGRTEVSKNDRWIWDYPLCMTVPNHSSCDNDCKGDFSSDSGEIVIKPKDYRNYLSCLWTINVNPNKKLILNFEKKAGFDVEYHKKCGYDRIHIFSGTIEGDSVRHARFCGPKDGEKPYDGTGKIVETDGVLPFWDTPYDLGSNQAIIGFDVDQKFVGQGFTLKWNSVPSDDYEIDFNNVFEAHQYLEEALTKQMETQLLFPKTKVKSKYQQKIQVILTKSKLAIENNPASDGEKKRRCAKSEELSVTPEVVQQIKDVYDARAATFRETTDAMIALLEEYLGVCKKAKVSWPKRLEKLAKGVENDRCPVGVDCRE